MRARRRRFNGDVVQIRTRLIVRTPYALRQYEGRATAWHVPDTSYPKLGFVGRAARSPGSVFFSARGRSARCPRCPQSRTDTRECPAAVGGLGRISAPFGSQVGRTLPHASAGHSRVFPLRRRRRRHSDTRRVRRSRPVFPARRCAITCARHDRRRHDRLPAAFPPRPLSPPTRAASPPPR